MGEMGEFVRSVRQEGTNEKGLVFMTGDLNVDSRTHNMTGGPLGEWGEVEGESEEYREMMRCLDVPEAPRHTMDLLKEAHGGIHPVTIGDVIVVDKMKGEVKPKEVVLTEVPDHLCRESKDYILCVPTPSTVLGDVEGTRESASDTDSDKIEEESYEEVEQKGKEDARKERVVVAVKKTRVEPFYLDPKVVGFPCTQLSDHYGVSATFSVLPLQ